MADAPLYNASATLRNIYDTNCMIIIHVLPVIVLRTAPLSISKEACHLSLFDSPVSRKPVLVLQAPACKAGGIPPN